MQPRNPWINLPAKAPYVLPEDEDTIVQFNKKLHADYRIQVNTLPEPYFGYKDAPVVLLCLNPGFSDEDCEVHATPEFQALLRNNYLHEPAEYPFYYLNPRFQNPGRNWWESKLKQLLKRVPREQLASSLFCIEYFPYHSRKFKRTAFALSSQKYGFYLARLAMEKKAVLILMRSHSLWYQAVPELKAYPLLFTLNSSQNVVISPQNCPGFDKVVSAIKHKSDCSRPVSIKSRHERKP